MSWSAQDQQGGSGHEEGTPSVLVREELDRLLGDGADEGTNIVSALVGNDSLIWPHLGLV
jgi:hypothetical protein